MANREVVEFTELPLHPKNVVAHKSSAMASAASVLLPGNMLTQSSE